MPRGELVGQRAGFGSPAPGWYKDSFGIVHLQGAAKQISTRPPLEIVLGTLPAAARPTRDVFTIVATNDGTHADLAITPTGQTELTNGSPNAGFGSASPGWYEDTAGNIHLGGALKQTSSSGPNASLVATLPAVVRPRRTVYTSAHTFSGTYADLAINPSGQILVIDPRLPAVTDLSFPLARGHHVLAVIA